MSLANRVVTLAVKYLFGPIWRSTPSLLRGIWSRSSPTRYHVARRHWTRSLKLSLLWRTIFYGYWFLFLARIFLGSYLLTLSDGKQFLYLQYDVWLYVMTYKQNLINFLGCLLSSALFLFLIYLDYLINLRQYNSAWGVMYEFVILNPTDFWSLNPTLKPKVDFESRPIESARNCLRLLRWLSVPPKALKTATFKVKKLRYVNPNCTKVMRAQAVVLSTKLQVIFAVLLYDIGFLTITSWIFLFFFRLVPEITRPSAYLLALVDALMCSYTIINTARLLILIGHSLILVQHFAGHQIRRITRVIQWSIRRFTSRSMSLSQFSYNLYIFHRNHNLALEDMIETNRHIVSRLILTGLGSQFLGNIYVITALYFIDFSPFNRLMMFTYVGVQIIILGVVIPPLITLVNDMYSYHPLLYRVVPLLRSGPALRQKLKMMSLYEITNTENRVTLTCGSLGGISSHSVYEFLAFYVAQLLFIFELFSEHLNTMNHYA